MSYIKVKNGEKTSDRKTSSGISWLEYWEQNTRHAAIGCSVRGCHETVEVGAHVYKLSENFYPNSPGLEPIYYIVPMCKRCNNPQNEEVMEVLESDLYPESI